MEIKRTVRLVASAVVLASAVVISLGTPRVALADSCTLADGAYCDGLPGMCFATVQIACALHKPTGCKVSFAQCVPGETCLGGKVILCDYTAG